MAVSCALLGHAAAQNVLGIDFGSEFIKLAVVQRSAGVQVCNCVLIVVLDHFKQPYSLAFIEDVNSILIRREIVRVPE